jgi:hypothetical protein
MSFQEVMKETFQDPGWHQMESRSSLAAILMRVHLNPKALCNIDIFSGLFPRLYEF